MRILRHPAHKHFKTKILFHVIKRGAVPNSIRDGRDHLLLIVPKAAWQQVLNEAHDALMSGHLGVARTYARI